MIVFDLKCSRDHVFEAWFGSTAAYDAQRDKGQVRCPLCDDHDVCKAVMAPAIASKGNSRPERSGKVSPEAAKAAVTALAVFQAEALKTSKWVGDRFAERARAMHLGEVTSGAIYGEASVAEARALLDDGVPIAPLLLPVVPPNKVN